MTIIRPCQYSSRTEVPSLKLSPAFCFGLARPCQLTKTVIVPVVTLITKNNVLSSQHHISIRQQWTRRSDNILRLL